MTTGLRMIAVGGLALGLMGATTSGDAGRKIQDIRKLMVLSGAAALDQQGMDQSIEMLRLNTQGVPDKFWEDFKKERQTLDLIELIVPIYDKYLSAEDIRGLIEFYESPVGRKFVSVQSQIVQEAMAVGQQWGMARRAKIEEMLKAHRATAESK